MASKLVGQNYSTPDLVAKVTGRAKYAEDYQAEGMLICRLLLSPLPHARIRSIDTSAALAMPGVKAILLPEDIPNPADQVTDLGQTIKANMLGQKALTSEQVYQGEPVSPWPPWTSSPPSRPSSASRSTGSRCPSRSTRSLAASRVAERPHPGKHLGPSGRAARTGAGRARASGIQVDGRGLRGGRVHSPGRTPSHPGRGAARHRAPARSPPGGHRAVGGTAETNTEGR